jgi:hypothetical protein
VKRQGGSARATIGRWWCVVVLCALWGSSLAWPGLARASDTPLPDNLEAANASVDENGVVHASGGAALTISSMINGATVRVEADTVDYDTRDGAAEMSGTVTITAVEYGFSVKCDSFSYDPLMQRMDVAGLEVAVPLSALIEHDELLFESRLSSDKHLYNFRPENVFLAAGQAHFDLSPDAIGKSDFVIEDVKLSPSARPDADLYVTAKELRLTPDERIVLSSVTLHVSDINVGPWPSISRRLHPKPGLIGYETPKIGFSRDKGVLLKQRMTVNLDPLKMEGLFDYSPEYGLRTYGFGYVEPMPGMKLGLAVGARSMIDRQRRAYVLTEDYNAVLRQRFKLHGPAIEDAWYILEYGHLITTPESTTGAPGGLLRQEDTREAAEGNVKFSLIPLGGKLYLATGALGKYVVYNDNDKNYTAVGGEAGLVVNSGGFEHYVMYAQNFTRGTPVFPMDEVRDRELSFATSVRLHPEWRHVIRGEYDIDREKFDKLQVGAMKKQRSYEIGLYWDFARNDAGVEIGLLLGQ